MSKYVHPWIGLRRRYGFVAIVLTIAFAALAATPQESQTASERLAQLRQQARAARERGDKQASVEAALALQKLLNDRPSSIEATALAYEGVGDNAKALSSLQQFVDAGQVDDDLLDPGNKQFAPLENLPQYKLILKRMQENKTAVEHSAVAFDLPDAGLLAEDIDFDPRSKTFLITSVLDKKIIRVSMHGKASDFAESPSHWPMLAVKVDAGHKFVWATEAALDGFAIVPKSDWGKSAVLCFALDTGKLVRRIEGPPGSALGDMVLAQDGVPIVSDGTGGGVYRVRGEKLEVANADDFISPQTATIDSSGRVFVPDYLRGIGVIDLASHRVSWIEGSGRYALNGIDGLYADGDWLIATQNGTSPERVTRFRLDASHTRIVSEEIIERATATLSDPTHGVVVGDSFFYIANSGWDSLDDQGNLKPGAKLTPAHIMRFSLKDVSRK